jgi:hypothetical protein
MDERHVLLCGRVAQRQGQPVLARHQRLDHRQGALADDDLGLLSGGASGRVARLVQSV